MPGREQDVVIGEDAPILEVMRTMRAMRRLAPDPVAPELLDRLVEAATWAPSGGNVQAYHFVVVTDRQKMAALADIWQAISSWYLSTVATVVPEGTTPERYERLKDALRFQADHFHETPAVIVACYDASGWQSRLRKQAAQFAKGSLALGPSRAAAAARNSSRLNAMSEAASVYPGVQNLLLTARALGLGATLTTWHLLLEGEVKAALGIPRRVKTFALIPVGWPLGRMGPVVRRPLEGVVHREGW